MKRIEFYVIYSADWGEVDYNGHTNHESDFAPPNADLWEVTEDGESEYEEFGMTEHRKWVTIEPIDREQMQQFIQNCGMYANTTETMGSLTLFGWLPAISFDADSPSEILDAYVTPIVEGKTLTEDDWPRLRDATINWARSVY